MKPAGFIGIVAIAQALLGLLICGWVGHHLPADAGLWVTRGYVGVSPFVGFALYCAALRRQGLGLALAAVIAGAISFAALFLGVMGAAAFYGS